MHPYDEKQCSVCPRPGKACSRCGTSLYCSKECQKFDWPLHRTLCGLLDEFKHRPDPHKRRAIYFPVDKPKPEFVWLPLDDENEPDFEAIRDKFFDQGQIWPLRVRDDPLRGIDLGHDIQLQCRREFLKDGSAVNQSIHSLSNKTCTYFKGPVLACASVKGMKSNKTGRITYDPFGMRTSRDRSEQGGLESDDNIEGSESGDSDTDYSDVEEFLEWRDMDTSDLRSIMNSIMVREPAYKASHLLTRSKEDGNFEGLTTIDEKDHIIKGVVINTDGDIRVNNLNTRYQEIITVSPMHLGIGHDSQIARLFGMPLFFMPNLREGDYDIDPNNLYTPAHHKVMRDVLRAGRMNMPPDSANPFANILMTELQNDALTPFGKISQKWRVDDLGPVHIFRRDGLPLSPAYLEAFCTWIKDDLTPKFAETHEFCDEELARDEKTLRERRENIEKLQIKMLDIITRARFYAWCKDKGIELKHV